LYTGCKEHIIVDRRWDCPHHLTASRGKPRFVALHAELGIVIAATEPAAGSSSIGRFKYDAEFAAKQMFLKGLA
jgi:hypothetical protein